MVAAYLAFAPFNLNPSASNEDTSGPLIAVGIRGADERSISSQWRGKRLQHSKQFSVKGHCSIVPNNCIFQQCLLEQYFAHEGHMDDTITGSRML